MALVSKLVVEISANVSSLNNSLTTASSSIGNFVSRTVKTLAKIGAIVAGAVAGAFLLINRTLSQSADNVDMLSKAAEKLNTPLKELQKLEFAGMLADVSSETLVRSMQLMGKNIFDAASKGGEAAQVFQRLGLNLQKLNNMSADQQFRSIAEALSQVSNAGERNNLQMQIFGRGGLELTNLILSNLKLSDELFDKLGLGLTDAQGKAVEAFNDTKSVIGKIWDGFKENVAANVAPAFTKINESIIETIAEMGGIDEVAGSVARGLINIAIVGVNAFSELRIWAKAFGVVIDGIGVVIAAIIAGINRLKNAIKNMSMQDTKDIIPLRQSMDVGDNPKMQKAADVLTSATNGVLKSFNTLGRFGQMLGKGASEFVNPGADQLAEEAAIMDPAFTRFDTNLKDAATSIRELRENAGELTKTLVDAKSDINNTMSGKAGKKPGDPGFNPALGAGGKTGGSAATESKLLSLDPKMNELLNKHAQQDALLKQQLDEAKAMRAFWESKAVDTGVAKNQTIVRTGNSFEGVSNTVANAGLGGSNASMAIAAEKPKPPQLLQITVSESATSPIVAAILSNMHFKLGVGELVLDQTENNSRVVAQ